ncbi:MAG: MerR family transcriptional regulator [Proteobacteria bacterium]|nr:MerR family transcriptional regulator [Pseudomonadota bacterium]
MEAIPDKVYFRIGEASSLVGVEAHVLRYWESEFGLKPTRTPSGQRRYRKEDVETLLRVRRLLHEQGFTIAGARKALSGEGEGDGAEIDSAAAREASLQIAQVRTKLAAMIAELRKPLDS